jgi:hypothetical protein
MFKTFLVILSGLIALIVSVLLIATTMRTALIPHPYCEKIYQTVNQCIPGCVWEFHEDEFTGIKISEDIAPLAPKNPPTCEGR